MGDPNGGIAREPSGVDVLRRTSRTNSDFGSRDSEVPLVRRQSTQSDSLDFPWAQQDQVDGQRNFASNFNRFFKKLNRRGAATFTNSSLVGWLSAALPCFRWLRTYNVQQFLLADIIAGLSVGFMLVPQSMSYAKLAGLPVEYGLYGGFLPVMAYAIFGSSPHLAVGPVAVTSLLLSSGLSDVTTGYKTAHILNPEKLKPTQIALQAEYNRNAIQVAFLVAVMYTSVGVLRLGFLTRFLSHSVISGFTSGASIIIALSQVKYILGVKIPQSSTLHETMKAYVDNIHQFKWQEFVMGSLLLIFLVTIKTISKRSAHFKWLRPLGPISVCIIGLLTVYIGKVDKKGISIVKYIPAGLPSPTIGWWFPIGDIGKLLPLAGIVCIVDLMESTSIARALAQKYGYALPYNQEIVGLGLANFAGAAFHSYTTTGSFSRSAVNSDTGARTPLAGFITSWVVGLVLLFLTPVFEKLPLNVLGAIVINSVTGLLDWENAIYLFKVNKQDWLVWMTCFIVTLFAGVELGLATSIGLALLIVVYESAFPHTARLGRIPRSTVYRNVKQYPEAERPAGLLVLRVDAPIYFANVAHITERIQKYLEHAELEAAATGSPVQYIIIDLSPVTHIDATGLHWLEETLKDMKQQGRQLVLCNPAPRVIAALEVAGIMEKLGRRWVFVRVHDAVKSCQNDMFHRVPGPPPKGARASEGDDSTPQADAEEGRTVVTVAQAPKD